MDVAEWLRRLGMEQYAPAFRENDIDGVVLSHLTAEDLRDLGVASIGHRRRLLDAIAALVDGPPAAVSVEMPAAPVPGDAERRQLSVMFCDLVGSTALSSRFDPEDLREIIGAYHGCVAETVGRFAGFVAKYMGDGVLVYFGYPQAHEDDTERAVRAGLAVVEAVDRLALPQRPAVRLGIASGLVVVGDLIGAGASEERGVVGETPNLAARLQALAQPGTVVIADASRRQLGRLFEVEDLGQQALAGFAEPQRAWRVVGESGEVSRFEALRGADTPLVGRDEEIDLLLRRWRQAGAGEGRAVLVSGEPGIGKSRLTAELAERIAGEPHVRLRYFCSPHHQDSALYPFILQLERAAGFARDDTAEQELAKLETLLALGTRDRTEITLLAELLSLPNEAAELNQSPQRRRERLFEALLRQLEAIARKTPVLMVFEDAHWIDPTSRELMDLTVARIDGLPALLVVTFRPEFQHGWGGRPHVTELALNRLAGRDGTALVEKLAGNMALSPEIVADIVDRTDGVPLFVEELTKAVLETADQENRVAAVLAAGPAVSLAIPATLHASLVARLDRLGTAAKEIAQIGAVLGREFTYELIEPVAHRADLDAALGQLSDASLLFCRGVPPHASYLFKHALVQDAAYGTLLRARRQELHTRVAAVLEQHFADLIERQPEMLAHHLTGAGENARAAVQWLNAGQHAAGRFAHLEAIRHYERGLALLPVLPEDAARDKQEIELQLARGLSLFTTEGFISATALQAYVRARELSEASGDTRQLVMAVYGQWQATAGSGGVVAGRDLSDRLLRLTDRDVEDGLRLQAHHSAWTTCLFAGEPAAAREHSNAGRAIYDQERHRSHRLLFGGHDPGVCARNMGGQSEWLLGYPDRAIATTDEALALASRLAHPLSLELTLLYRSLLHLDRREPELALEQLEAAETLVGEQRLAFLLEPRLLRGAALLGLDMVEEGVVMLRKGLDTALGKRISRPQGLLLLAEALVRLGEWGEALAVLGEAFETMNATGQRQWEAELHRVTAFALLGRNQREEGRNAFGEALRVAHEQQAKAYELRAATSLARLLGEQSRRAEACELLAPVYGWFTEGFDTADLKEAAVLLSELA